METSKPEDAFHPSVIARKRLGSNARFDVYFDEMHCPGEPETRDYLVVVPKVRRDDQVTGVVVLPLCDGKIGLVRAYRHAVGGESWEVPRGFIDEHESSQASALREMEEETGLSCRADQIWFLGQITPDAGILAARLHLFAATQCIRRRPFRVNEMGHRDFRLFDRDAVEAMMQRSEIQDAYTIIAYSRYKAIAEGSGRQTCRS